MLLLHKPGYKSLYTVGLIRTHKSEIHLLAQNFIILYIIAYNMNSITEYVSRRLPLRQIFVTGMGGTPLRMELITNMKI